MGIATVHTRSIIGIHAPAIAVEAHISSGQSKFSIVGLAETVVKESKDRVRSAIINCGFDFPFGHITVNLAPASIPKEGCHFDLPIALAILVASHQLLADAVKGFAFAGELGLTGALRYFKGGLPLAMAANKANSKQTLILPKKTATEARLVQDAEIYQANHLLEVIGHLLHQSRLKTPPAVEIPDHQARFEIDYRDVKAQKYAKRVLTIAAAGEHSLLMHGPPGTGKTMLASRLPTILPSLNTHDALEVAALASISKEGFNLETWKQPPFRSPHHTASGIALVGGGSNPRPGEVSLAHHGVLFLDELPEFQRQALEVLREPLESGSITISRAARSAVYPANFQLIAAMNPCPCGHLGDTRHECRCTPQQIARYHAKISGPLLDRIDLHLHVKPCSIEQLRQSQDASLDSTHLRERVEQARAKQLKRQQFTNRHLTGKQLMHVCQLSPDDATMLENAMTELKISARAYHRILRVSRTMADLEGSDEINRAHLLEALSYRHIATEHY